MYVGGVVSEVSLLSLITTHVLLKVAELNRESVCPSLDRKEVGGCLSSGPPN